MDLTDLDFKNGSFRPKESLRPIGTMKICTSSNKSLSIVDSKFLDFKKMVALGLSITSAYRYWYRQIILEIRQEIAFRFFPVDMKWVLLVPGRMIYRQQVTTTWMPSKSTCFLESQL